MESYVTPLKDKVLIRYRSRKQGLVFIPHHVEEQERLADVVEVGGGCRYVSKGDVVMTFEGVCGEQFGDCNVVNEGLIMGIMDGDFPVPYSNRVIVLPDPHPERHGSIYIPDTAKGKVLVGTVLAAGDGKYYGDVLVGNEVKKGDRVLYAKFSGGYDGFKIGGVNHLSMRDEDILMVLE